jgi:hypothetical protein
MWTLGDAFQFGNWPQAAVWVDPRTRKRDADSGMENSVSFFCYRNLETPTGVFELQEIELTRCGEHNCNEYHLHIGAYAISGRFCVTRARAVLAIRLLHDAERGDGL